VTLSTHYPPSSSFPFNLSATFHLSALHIDILPPQHGCSIPRLMVYKAYTAHTESMMMNPANAAGFGKLIRSVFPTVTSR